MREERYWAERFKQLEASQHDSSERLIGEMQRQMRRAEAEIGRKIEAWYGRLMANNGVSMAEARKLLNNKELEEFRWDVDDYIRYGQENAVNQQWMKQLENASARVHISRLEQLKLQVQQEAEKLYGNYLDSVDRHMKSLYEEGFYRTAYEIQKGTGIGWNLTGVDSDRLEKIIRKPWAADGKNFSERIWSSKQQLIENVHTSLTQMCVLGQAPDRAIDSLAKAMRTSKSQAGRLIMTEAAFFGSEARKDSFRELGVEQYEIVATLDSSTSEICREMDGKVFPMSEYAPGATAPPFHVWCRTTTVPAFGDEFDHIGERAARDSETGKTYYVPADMTYKEWKEGFVNASQEQDTVSHVTKLIERMNDHEPISILDLGSRYGEEIKAVVENAPSRIKEFIIKHKDEITVINESAKLGNRESVSGIRVNLKKDSVNERGKWCGIFHETGHRVDRILGYPSETLGFERTLRADFRMLVKEYQKVYNISREAAYQKIGMAITEPEYHSVSDLFSALSDGRCKGHYTHRKNYWDKAGNLGKEAFAHFFEAAIRRDSAKTEYLKQSFPEAYKMFEAMLEGMK